MQRRLIPTMLVFVALAGALVGAAARPPAARAAGARVAAMKQAIVVVAGCVDLGGANNYYSYPSAAGLCAGAPRARLWPRDPWTGKPLAIGRTRGHYRYTVSRDHRSYRVVGYLGKGATYTVRGGMPRSAKTAYDHRGEEGLNLIRQYVEKWSRSNGGLYPGAAEVSHKGAVGLLDGGLYWPSNPWDHAAMTQRDDDGSFAYRVAADGRSYTLALHRALKEDYVLSGSAPPPAARAAAASPPWLPVSLLLIQFTVSRAGAL